jgi:hypothetical protein
MDQIRVIKTVLRCYPARWRRRHGTEAAELAALLIGDGTPAGSIAVSYLAGAAREWLTPRPSRRLRAVACGLLIAAGALGASAGVLGATVPARAAAINTGTTTTGLGTAPCQPGPDIIAALGRPQVTIRRDGHDRSC